MTDVDPLADEGQWSDVADVRSLLYVAVTRALARVVMIAHESWRERLAWGPMDGTGLAVEEARAVWGSGAAGADAGGAGAEALADAGLREVAEVLRARVGGGGDAVMEAALRRLGEIAGGE